ncbi:MAG: hypothetical protein IPJ12_00950 [Betaproteobacteria bacterium]|nr:hypothetical protein [Betaproteobacteria bacterium]
MKKELLQFAAHASHATFAPSPQKSDDRRRIPDAVSISERPPQRERRTGAWEGDLLWKSQQSVATPSNVKHALMLVKVASKDAETFANALSDDASCHRNSTNR